MSYFLLAGTSSVPPAGRVCNSKTIRHHLPLKHEPFLGIPRHSFAMRLIHTLSVMVLLVTVFMIFFYFTLNQETGSQAGAENLLEPRRLNVQDSDVKTQSLKQESITIPSPNVPDVTVSAMLRETIPQNGAYWNRLLYSGLKKLEEGRKPFGNYLDWSHCREANQEILQTNMHDVSSYPALFLNFLQAMNCRSPPVLLDQPSKCVSSEGEKASQIFLLLAIKSNPRNFEQRQAVRETWGKEGVNESGLRVRTVFLVGTSQLEDPDVNPLISFEAKHFGDIVQWDFHDSFFNLTLKMNMFLQWTLKRCPRVSFVFSGDDDVFVNTPALLNYLQSLDASKASRLYVGHVISTASPHRDPNNKYYIPVSFYDGPYPAYAGGGGFLFSGALLQSLYSVLHFIPFYPIDDVYTAMCFLALGVTPEPHTGFLTFDIKVQDRENLCVHKGLILIHQRTPSQTKKLWKGIHSPLLTC